MNEIVTLQAKADAAQRRAKGASTNSKKIKQGAAQVGPAVTQLLSVATQARCALSARRARSRWVRRAPPLLPPSTTFFGGEVLFAYSVA